MTYISLEPDCGTWHENAFAFAVSKIAIETVLSKLRPSGEPVDPPADGQFHPVRHRKRRVSRLPRQRSSPGDYDGQQT